MIIIHRNIIYSSCIVLLLTASSLLFSIAVFVARTAIPRCRFRLFFADFESSSKSAIMLLPKRLPLLKERNNELLPLKEVLTP